jgi:hypothetical protein
LRRCGARTGRGVHVRVFPVATRYEVLPVCLGGYSALGGRRRRGPSARRPAETSSGPDLSAPTSYMTHACTIHCTRRCAWGAARWVRPEEDGIHVCRTGGRGERCWWTRGSDATTRSRLDVAPERPSARAACRQGTGTHRLMAEWDGRARSLSQHQASTSVSLATVRSGCDGLDMARGGLEEDRCRAQRWLEARLHAPRRQLARGRGLIRQLLFNPARRRAACGTCIYRSDEPHCAQPGGAALRG